MPLLADSDGHLTLLPTTIHNTSCSTTLIISWCSYSQTDHQRGQSTLFHCSFSPNLLPPSFIQQNQAGTTPKATSILLSRAAYRLSPPLPQLSFKLLLKRRHHHGIPASWQVSSVFLTSSDFNHLRGCCEPHLNHFGGRTGGLRKSCIVN